MDRKHFYIESAEGDKGRVLRSQNGNDAMMFFGISNAGKNMITHQTFTNIRMHSDQELADILGACIVSRNTIHEWPLSCVQKLTLDNGRDLIYKSQLPPTVEPDFYEHAVSRLLPACQVIGKLDDCDTMIIDWLDAPLLSDEVLSTNELIEHGKHIIAQIRDIGGDLPVYLNIGSDSAWLNTVQTTMEKLNILITDGRFNISDHNALENLRRWSRSDQVLEAITCNPHVIHGDLKADQVFLVDGEYRIIDWQRPYVAPSEVDFVSLLINQHVEPYPIVKKAVIDIFWFLRLHWAIEAQFTLFPDKRWLLFNHWAMEAIENIFKE
jgi:hypothetical protein